MSLDRYLGQEMRAAVRDELHAAKLARPAPWPISVSIKDAAAMLSVSTDTVYALIRDGRLRTMDFGPNLKRKVVSVPSMLELDPGFDIARHFRLIDAHGDDDDVVQGRKAS